MTDLNVTGPLLLTLTIVDTNGFMAISQPLILPKDPDIAPAARITGFGIQ